MVDAGKQGGPVTDAIPAPSRYLLQIAPRIGGRTRDMANQNEPQTASGEGTIGFRVKDSARWVAFRAHVMFRGKIRDISQSGCFAETRAHLNLPRPAEVEVRFTVSGLTQSVLARLMDLRPGKGAGFQFLVADPRLDNGFHKLLERLEVAEPAKG